MNNSILYDNQSTMFWNKTIIWFWNEILKVEEIDKKISDTIIIKNHYSKKVYNWTYIHLWVFYNNEIVWVLQYWYAMNPASCWSVVEWTMQDEYLELNRMWIKDNVIEYIESQAISLSIKYIKSKFRKIKWIQSFADERCGWFWIVYQACSFSYYWEHTSSFWELDWETFHNSIKTSEKAWPRWFHLLNNPDSKDRVIHHELRQFRYIKYLDNRYKNKCLHKEKKYPKHYL